MLIHVDHIPTAISARSVVPQRIWVRPEPDVESAKEDPVRIVRIDRDRLIVPVLRVVAGTARAIGKRSARRARNLSPGRAAISRAVGAELAAVRVPAATIWVWSDGLQLG